jgi:hypothetical protein
MTSGQNLCAVRRKSWSRTAIAGSHFPPSGKAAPRMELLIQFLLAVFRVSLTLIGNLSPFITAT